MAATPCAAFLVAVSMLERRAAQRGHAAIQSAPVLPAVPGQDSTDSSSPPGDGQDGRLLALARRAADEHQAAHGQPITRDALRARLSVSNQAASGLLRQIRTREGPQKGGTRQDRRTPHDPPSPRRAPGCVPDRVSAGVPAGVCAGVLGHAGGNAAPRPLTAQVRREIDLGGADPTHG